jgi:hypothetical protein
MPLVPRCPTCRRLNRRASTEPGTKVTCEWCEEVFEASKCLVEAEPADPKRAAAKAKPASPSNEKPRAAGDAKPAPARPRRREEDDEPPRRPGRARRREESSGSGGVVVLLLALGLGAFLVAGLAGGAIWYSSQKREQAAQERAEAAEFEVDRARRDAARAAEEQELVQRAMREDVEAAERERQRLAALAPPEARPPAPAPGPGLPGPFLPPAPGPFVPPAPPVEEPPAPPKAEAVGLPRFDEPVNPVPPGKQTKLRELTAVSLPKLPAPPKNALPRFGTPAAEHFRVVHSPRHQLLFVLSPKSAWAYDLKAKKALGEQTAKEAFTDMSLAPDESALFVADYGGEHVGYGTPLKPSRVHRFDLKSRQWEDRTAPKVAWKAEAVDGSRVLLLERDQWVSVTLNKWEEDGVGVRELARIGSDYNGDIEYDPRTGRIYHGNRGISSPQITVNVVDGDKLKPGGNTGTYGTASKGGGGGSVVLSQDGSRFYYGRLQVKAASVKENLETFPEVIVAASRDIAFGSKAYYRATTGSKLGEFDFKTGAGDPRFGGGSAAAITVSPDGQSVWVIDRDKNTARQYALEEGK